MLRSSYLCANFAANLMKKKKSLDPRKKMMKKELNVEIT
jgi:hypothetical protein